MNKSLKFYSENQSYPTFKMNFYHFDLKNKAFPK